MGEKSSNKGTIIFVIVCGSFVIFAWIFPLLKSPDVDNSTHYQERYTKEEQKEFEHKKNQVLFTQYKEELVQFAKNWTSHALQKGPTLSKEELTNFYFKKEYVELLEDGDGYEYTETYTEDVFVSLFIDVESLWEINNNTYQPSSIKLDDLNSKVVVVDDESLSIFKYNSAKEFAKKEDVKALELASQMPYFFVLENLPLDFEHAFTNTVAVTVYNRDRNEISDFFNVSIYAQNNRTLQKNIREAIMQHYKSL